MIFRKHPKPRLIVIGLDGIPVGLIRRYTADGTMPKLARLVEEGQLRSMHSSVPPISSVAWSSIITGVNAGTHGIYGFTDLAPDSYRLIFPNFSHLKTAPFWTRKGIQSVIINVPSTYPARPMNGVHLSGFVALDLDKAVYPGSVLGDLKRMGYQIDVDVTDFQKSKDLFWRRLEDTLDGRIAAMQHFFPGVWDAFMLVFTGTDRLGHFFWELFDRTDHPLHARFRDHFAKIDSAVGWIMEQMESRDTLMMLSDHGFEKMEKEVYINTLLHQQGFLKTDPWPARSWNDIREGALAFALDPGRIYLHTRDRYPRGGIAPEEAAGIRAEIKAMLEGWTDEAGPVLTHIWEKEAVFDGPLLDQAPDLVVYGRTGLDIKGSIKKDTLYDEPVFTGKHTYGDAFFLTVNERHPVEFDNAFDVIDAGRWIQEHLAG